MVKQYMDDYIDGSSGTYSIMREATAEELSEGSYYVDGSDYEQLHQAHSKAVELAAQLAKQVGELTEERDALAAYCEELKVAGLSEINEVGHSQTMASALVAIEELLNKSPQICLAEHDAEVIEEAVRVTEGMDKYGWCNPDDLKEYAQQLRDGTLD